MPNDHLESKFLGRNYLIKNVGITQACGGISVASGVVLDAIILANFGVGWETDALFAALALPLVLVNTLEMEAPKVIVPALTRSLQEHGPEKRLFLLRNLVTVFALIGASISLLNMGLAWVLIPVQVPGLASKVLRLSIHISLVVSWIVFLRTISAVLKSFLYSNHRYVAASTVTLVRNAIVIVVVGLFQASSGIHSVAVGFLVGDLAALLVLTMASASSGFTYAWEFRLKDPQVREILRLSIYPLVGDGLGRSVELVENLVASFLGSGTLSTLKYATRIITALAGVLFGGITTATLPMVSHYAAQQNLEKMKESLLSSLKLLFFIGVPISVWLIFACKPGLVLLFVRGEFTVGDAALVSTIVALMAPAILFGRVSAVSQTPFFATRDMRTPLFCRILGFATNLGLILLLVQSLGIYSFAIARSTAMFFVAIVTLSLFQKKFGPLKWHKLSQFGSRLGAVMVLTTSGLFLSSVFNSHFIGETLAVKVGAFMVPTAVAATIFITTAIFTGLIKADYLTILRAKSNS